MRYNGGRHEEKRPPRAAIRPEYVIYAPSLRTRTSPRQAIIEANDLCSVPGRPINTRCIKPRKWSLLNVIENPIQNKRGFFVHAEEVGDRRKISREYFALNGQLVLAVKMIGFQTTIMSYLLLPCCAGARPLNLTLRIRLCVVPVQKAKGDAAPVGTH